CIPKKVHFRKKSITAITAESAAIESNPEELSGYRQELNTRRRKGMEERWTVSLGANSSQAMQIVTVVDETVLAAAQSGQRLDPHLEQHHPASARGWRLHRGAPAGTRRLAPGDRVPRPVDRVSSAERNSPEVYQNRPLGLGQPATPQTRPHWWT